MSISPKHNEAFTNGLKMLSMLNDENTGLYFADSIEITNPYVLMHLEEAQRYKPDAIYITQLENQPLIPQIYIYDNTTNKFDDNKITQLHKQLWNAYKVPMFFVFSKTKIEIYNCLQKPQIAEQELQKISPLETISLVAEINKAFSAEMFDTGAFWNTKYANYFLFKNSVYESLLDELKTLRDNLIQKKMLSKEGTESLLIKSILLRYLEERGVFEEGYWNGFQKNANSFIDLFDDSKVVVKLLDDLSEHFNGAVFKLRNNDERDELLKADLKEFKYFLKGNKQGKQLLLWSLYSFKDLPIELISNIYELFLKSEDKEKKGIVYTPPILVNFMIDEIMPLDKPQKNFKLLDPSCGSGIFLVAAYKRLIQWWMIENKWKKPSPTVARNIIKKSIYGVDIHPGAVQLSIFSLSLALCDTLQPDAIWDELKFDNLEESNNIIHKDFFNYVQEKEFHNKFDLVIGNPPFVSDTDSTDFKILEKEESKNRPKIDNKQLVLPDKQLALLFLEQGFKLLKPDAFLCMIQPSAFLYSQNSHNFRNYLFKEYKCKQIIDFACLNSSLFKRKGSGADVAVSVSFMKKQKADIKKDIILHITVRQTFLAKEKIYFDLSHYDFHWLKYEEVLNQKSIWKSDLMGGSRIRSIINRLDNYPKLQTYLKYKEENNHWLYRSGFFVGNKAGASEFLYNKPTLPTKAFSESGIDKSKIEFLQDTLFEAPRQKELFQPPLVLIKEVLGNKKLLVEYIDTPLSFRKGITGIHAPIEDESELKYLSKRLKEQSSLYIFYLIATSGRAGVSKATSLLKKDIDLLPYPNSDVDFKLSKVEQYFADDTMDYMMDFCKGNNNSPLLEAVTPSQLEEFQAVYCDLLNSIYNDFKVLNVFETESFSGCSFYYKDKPTKILLENSKELDENLVSIINYKSGQNVNVKRVLRFYDENIIYIIKPKQYRFWLKSIAVRDADETFADLVKMGY